MTNSVFARLALLSLACIAGCATAPAVARPSGRAQAVTKCLAAADAGIVVPACAPLASDVAALRVLSAKAVR